ncbi:MAG TPA: VWA domain-containing protein, partial [Anaerolineales bacterium]|nr:VWA domain-containing protein [Anaerolineales bacterium]
MRVHTRNRLLFAGYTLLTLVIFFAALIFPPVRAFAPAPLRDWFGAQIDAFFTSIRVPNVFAGRVAIEISSSNTKEDWMNAVAEKFNTEQHTTASGQIIEVTVKHVTSGGSQQSILDGKSTPTVWSPGDQSWVDEANRVWRDRNGRLLVPDACPPTVLAPVGFALWRPMAEVLGWPDTPISWDDIARLSANPEGWAAFGHPEWGTFKFGHTHPDYSNVGLLMMTALAYSIENKTSGLTAQEVYSPDVVDAFANVEINTYHYGIQNRPLMKVLAERGPSYLHGVTTSEAEVLKTNKDFADVLRFQLVFIFPAKGTYWGEHPYCILDGDWVSDEQKEAAGLFRDYLLASEQQSLTIDNYLRPIDTGIPLRSPIALDEGTDPRVTRDNVPSLESPTAEVATAVQDVFHQTKKKATILMVIDTSGSMEGEKIRSASESSANFIKRLHPDDEIYVIGFSGATYQIGGGRAGDVGESLFQSVSNLLAEGNTALNDATCEALEAINQLKAEDEAADERRLYGVVILSDGEDTASFRSENQMFECLPTGEDVTGVKVFTIAFGEDADKDL